MEFECKRSSTVSQDSHFQAREYNHSHSTLEYKFPMTCTVHTIRTFNLSCACAFAQLKFPRAQFALLQCSLIGVSSKRYGGGSTVLTSEEERESVRTCEILAEMGFPLTKAYVEVVVRDSQKSRPH